MRLMNAAHAIAAGIVYFCTTAALSWSSLFNKKKSSVQEAIRTSRTRSTSSIVIRIIITSIQGSQRYASEFDEKLIASRKPCPCLSSMDWL
ncbi:hypothetical protein BJV82DRAFT_589686 [Fennellomyces sp. T-0311]|nr:hypothetical protein BJV82DRAFT_589686 [Fennellomyces sp. T-0311]